MKLINMEQLNAATSAQSSSRGKDLGEVLVELNFISPAQLEKLASVQRDVIAKHRAKQAASAGGQAAARAPAKPAAAPPQPQRVPAVKAPPAPAAAAPLAAPAPPPPAAPARPAPAEAVSAPPPARVEAQSQAPPATPAQTPAAARAPQRAPEIDASDGEDEEGDSLGLSARAPTEQDRTRLRALLARAVEAGSSDIHIHSGAPVKVRINGALTETDAEVLSLEDTERLVMSVLSENERAELLRYGEVDACCDIEGVGRFRTNVYRQQRGFDAVLRSVPKEPPTLDQLGLPAWIAKYTNYHQGMVLITGPAGCGKSATLAAMVNLINEERNDHILTIEDPIEVVHPSKSCLVNQRHAGRHTGSFARALRAALREDPDVIVIGELRDLETISLAMTAAETGHFVLATLHTNNAVRTINRMIGAFPSNQQGQVRTMLSESLRAVISQRLVPTADESGRVAALELLVINKAIGNMIRDEKTIQIRSSIQTGSAHGMMLLEQSLNELVKGGKITREAALELAEEKKLITA
jgi:twitching motility protein PilT